MADFANSPAGPLRRRGRADPHEARAATPVPATARRAGRTGSGSACWGSTRSSITRAWSATAEAGGSSRRARVEPAAAQADGPVPHGGGQRFAVGSPEYRTIARWIGQGMPFDAGKEPELVADRGRARAAVIPRRGPAATPRRGPLRRRDHGRRHPPGPVPVERPRPGRSSTSTGVVADARRRRRGGDHGAVRRPGRRSPGPRSLRRRRPALGAAGLAAT